MAAGVKSKELRDYFAQAESWDHDRFLTAKRSARRAWIVAGSACILAVVSVGAVAALTPLKTVQPYTVTVDRQTGATEITTALTGSDELLYDEAVAKYFLARYVRYREGWVSQARLEYFEAVTALSAPGEQNRFAAYYRDSNPQSPQVVFGNDAFVTVAIKNISLIGKNVAQVRFSKVIQRGGAVPDEVNAIATVNYDVTGKPTGEQGLFVNPLGYRVTNYRADREVPGA